MADQPASTSAHAAVPFAISSGDEEGRGRNWRNLAALVVIGGMVAAGLSGVLGGGPSHVQEVSGSGVRALVTFDPIMRSGNWFEMTVAIDTQRPIKDLVIAVDEDLWRKMSVDTIAPDAESAEALDHRYRYHFGKMAAGEHFQLKLDGQIQAGMLRLQRGKIAVLNDKQDLLALPINLTVLP